MFQTPFQIKICGVTNVADAVMVADAGADALGLNFVASSPRAVDLNVAKNIANAVRSQVQLVGVFVNQPLQEIEHFAAEVGLDLLQLHGDEPLEMIESLGPARVVRAIRCRDADYQDVRELLARIETLKVPAAAVLLDAYAPGAYGGTGAVLDWSAMRESLTEFRLPMILAGGLTPQNVAQAVVAARPQGVDTASGVESAPGKKSPQLVTDFVVQARASFGELD